MSLFWLDFSYWVASKLPLEDKQRIALLKVESAVQRLRAELNLLKEVSPLTAWVIIYVCFRKKLVHLVLICFTLFWQMSWKYFDRSIYQTFTFNFHSFREVICISLSITRDMRQFTHYLTHQNYDMTTIQHKY